MEQHIHFCTTSDGVRIAYATVGEGPPLVKAANWLNHLEFDWQSPIWRHLLEEFARDHLLVRYDERGNGLSDWDVEDLSFDEFVRDLESVVDAVGLSRFPLLGISQGGAVAIAYAVRHPERVSHLILYGAYARGWAMRGSSEEIDQRKALLTLTKLGWGQDNPAYRQLWTTLYVPDAAPEQMHWFNDLQRVSASPENAVRLLNEFGKIDVLDLLPQVRVPTLVLHCRNEVVVPFEEGRLLASSIPGALFVPLEGRNHLLLESESAWAIFIAEVRRFLGTEKRAETNEQDSQSKSSRKAELSRRKLPDRYSILSSLGAGGMGEVYLAQDARLDRKVAIKVLPPESTADERARKRLIREAQAAAKLDHPNICAIYEVGDEQDAGFIVMQYVEGETLAKLIQRKPLDLRESLDIAVQIAGALAEAHSRGIVHRDIKPQNVMITARGQVKVLDFGLAKIVQQKSLADSAAETESLLTEAGMIIGTVPYMSPEQVRGETLDARSDIFSYGAVLYEVVAGRQPFAGESAAATLSAILTHEAPPLARYAADVPEELQRIVRKCLEKDRERRYQMMRDVTVDLENVRREREAAQLSGSRGEQTTRNVAAARTDQLASRHGLFRHRFAVGVVVLALIAIAAIVYALVLRRGPAIIASEIKSLAVLPLEDLSGGQAQDYFADGMTEALITDLAKIGALRVISRTSVMRYKGERRPLPEIARELNVDALIVGSVLRSGDRVRISAQLIHAASDQHLWAESYERDMRDILTLQSEVARRIAQEIRIKLTSEQEARLANVRPVNPEAYDYYLRGKFHSGRQNKFDNETAIAMLERAVAMDPNFATAHSELARAYNTRAFFFAPQEKLWEEKAFVAVEKALSLDPNLAEAYLARGDLLWTHSNHFPHERAAQELRRALTLSPNLDEAYHKLAVVYAHIGLLDKALQELEQAVAINPSNTLARLRIGIYLSYQGKYEQALTIFQSIPKETFPSAWGFSTAWALFQLGRKDEAAALVEQFLKTYPKDEGGVITGIKAVLAAAAGDERKAEKSIKTAVEVGKDFGHFHHTAYFIASAYALMNKPEQAIKWLQGAADDGFPCYPLFENDPSLNQIRKDQRFIALMARLKQQWEHYQATL